MNTNELSELLASVVDSEEGDTFRAAIKIAVVNYSASALRVMMEKTGGKDDKKQFSLAAALFCGYVKDVLRKAY